MNTPKNALNNVEYLCLKMFLNPGQSQRFYRKALMQYVGKGVPVDSDGVAYGIYFRKRGKYHGRLWTDRAPKTVETMNWDGKGMRPAKSELHLTKSGINRAIKAAAKIGLVLVEQRALTPTIAGDLGGIPTKGAVACAPIGFR